jgi:hypothetical protein
VHDAQRKVAYWTRTSSIVLAHFSFLFVDLFFFSFFPCDRLLNSKLVLVHLAAGFKLLHVLHHARLVERVAARANRTLGQRWNVHAANSTDVAILLRRSDVNTIGDPRMIDCLAQSGQELKNVGVIV